MNKAICFFLLMILLSTSVMAANKVVVIPLSSVKKLQNIVTVSQSGGDFTSPVTAVNSITDATESNPYLVVVGPGVYTLTTPLIMKEYVSVTGAGQGVTKLTGNISTASWDATSAIVSGADNSTLSNLSIENLGDNFYSFSIYNYDTSPTLYNLSLTASGGTSNVGIYSFNSSSIMKNVTIAIESAGTNSIGIAHYSNSSPTIMNVSITTSGATNNRGITNTSSSPTVRNSKLQGTSEAVYIDSGVVTIMGSSIIGGVKKTGGTLRCINADNGINKELDENCLEVP